ncbi:MAG: hypothetical protein IT519_09995 [Burkholderiales bacterium]|jgi:hypothetical protein|nr:hypothetical protein [Burkholderiales bacterium]
MPLRRRDRDTSTRPWITREDAALAVELPILALLALATPERSWRGACRRLEGAKARLKLFDPGPVANAAQRVFGTAHPAFDARGFALDSAAGRSEHHLQILRASVAHWAPQLRLEGRDHLDGALASKHGAVLWVAHFCFNALATKQAMAAAGFRAWHLSRPEHGFSKSRIGIATVNRIRVRAELAHLAGRIEIDRAKPMSATLAAQRTLKENGIVSVTAGAWEGQRLAAVRLLGGSLELAVGAPGLARLSGAVLLPVFTVRVPSGDIRVVIEAPIPVAGEGEKDEVLTAAAQAFADRLEGWVRRFPEQWRDWKNLKLPAPDSVA